jgi:GMP synthase-like glutamine amidotransferase
MMGKIFGGKIGKNPKFNPDSTSSRIEILDSDCSLLNGISNGSKIFLKHKHWVEEAPKDFIITARAIHRENNEVECSNIAMDYRINGHVMNIFSIQFHPEHPDTDMKVKERIFRNFLDLCN